MNNKKKLILGIKEAISYLREKINLPSNLKVSLISDCANSKNMFGKTAHYNPENKKISLYIKDRHDKDILRSLFHECIHAYQDMRGELEGKLDGLGEGYAQKDKYLRALEEEAYSKGNLLFRDYEDSKKEKNSMSIQEKIDRKNRRIGELLLERYVGIKTNLLTEEGVSGGVMLTPDIGKKLCQWHENRSDPVYKVGSLAKAGEPAQIELVQETISSLEKIYDAVDREDDKSEVDSLLVELSQALQTMGVEPKEE